MADTQTTPLDSELVAAGATLRERGLAAPPPHTAPLGEARAGYDAIGEFLCGLAQDGDPVDLQALTVEGPHGAIECIIAGSGTPERPAPALIHLHGGGFALGRARDWARFATDLSAASGISVVLVDYRLAPEHPFPVAFEETLEVIRHVRLHGLELGLDPDRVAVGGDSAGANLALSAAIANAAGDPEGVKALLLFYGVFKHDFSPEEWKTLGGFGLSPELMDWIWRNYLGEDFGGDWRATPHEGDLRGLPPTIQIVGDLDPLIDDARQLKAKLDQHGVANTLAIEAGLNHGFVRLGPLSPRIDAIVRGAARQLGGLLRG